MIFIFLATFLSTVFFTFRQTPIYSAKTTIKIDEPKTIGEFIIWGGREQKLDIRQEIRFLESPQFRGELVKRMALVPEWATQDEFKNIAGSLGKNIKILGLGKWTGETDFIEITAVTSSAENSAELANAAAQTYAELNLKERTRKARDLRQSVEKQLAEYKVKMDKYEQDMANFKIEKGNVQAQKNIIEKRLEETGRGLTSILKEGFPLGSPKVKEAEGLIQGLKEQLRELASKELEIESLNRELEYNRQKYEKLRKWVIALKLTEENQAPDVRIVNPASLPKSPIRPKKLLNAFAGALAGLLVGVFSVFIMENLEIPLATIEEVESFTKLPVMGAIPYLLAKEEKKKFWQRIRCGKRRSKLPRLKEQLVVNYPFQSPIAESYKSLRTRIQSLALEKGIKALLITSTGPAEGKSITCANLAISIAQTGQRVLLVGGDLRRPLIYKLFGLNKEPGLSDCLMGTAKWEDLVQPAGLDNLKIITCGHSIFNPSEVLQSQKTRQLITELKQSFDIILFDSPPVLPIADASIFGAMLDGVILIYQVGKVRKDAFLRAKKQLEGVGASIKGVILNNTSREIEAYPPYRYYYYKDYGEKEKKLDLK